ncbi:MAG: hypothetical protein IJE92_01305, partial [Clostridia bacterium]|nr:hypothetical protein [Clostridia bacterium]
MTYQQMQQIESYIDQVDSLIRDRELDADLLYSQATTLHEMVYASNIGYQLSLDWDKCVECEPEGNFGWSISGYFGDEIIGNLQIMRAALKGILNSNENYATIVDIRKDISRGQNLKKSRAKRNFIAEMVVKYQGEIDFGKTIADFLKEDMPLCWDIDEDAYFNGLLQKLESHINDISCTHHPVKSKSVGKQPTFVINQNVNQSQEMTVDVAITITDCFNNLDDCETLSETEIEDIKAQLQEIQDLLSQ